MIAFTSHRRSELCENEGGNYRQTRNTNKCIFQFELTLESSGHDFEKIFDLSHNIQPRIAIDVDIDVDGSCCCCRRNRQRSCETSLQIDSSVRNDRFKVMGYSFGTNILFKIKTRQY